MTTDHVPGGTDAGREAAPAPDEWTPMMRREIGLWTASRSAGSSASPSWEAECGCPHLCLRDHQLD